MALLDFFKNLKAKRAAKAANKKYQAELAEWQSETDILNQALEIFKSAAEGKEVDDQSLVQKNGEFVIWTGNAVFHEAGRGPSRYVGGSQGFSIPIVAGIRYRVGSFSATRVPGEAMQIDKDQGFVKLTNQRLIFAGALETNEWAFSGPGPLLVQEFTNHIAGSFLPPIPEHLVAYQDEIRKKKSNVSHFFLVLEETFDGANLSPRLEQLLRQAFTSSRIEEVKIDLKFLEELMEALDLLKTRFARNSSDILYLEKLISTIFSFYKLLKNR